mgnify:CR=1 FL=1
MPGVKDSEVVLKVEHLKKYFPIRGGLIRRLEKKERVLRRWTMFHFLYSRGKH